MIARQPLEAADRGDRRTHSWQKIVLIAESFFL